MPEAGVAEHGIELGQIAIDDVVELGGHAVDIARDFVVGLVFVVGRLVVAQIDVENQTAKLSSQAIAVIHGIGPAGAGIGNHQFLLDFEHFLLQRFGGVDDARR